MLTVSPDEVVVESQLMAGVLACPGCGGQLAPWAWARARVIGRGGRGERVRPRRGRCRACRATHVLLPAALLLRRCDPVEVIGRALELAAGGWTQRGIVVRLGIPRSTVRGWLARFAARGRRLRAQFVRWAMWLAVDVVRIEPSGSALADVVTAVVVAARAAAGELAELGRWQFAAAATAGRLLCNTSAPFPAPWRA